MATPYVGQIMMFGGSFAPVNYAFCNGQSMSISQNQVLYAVIGTIYGGDGQQTFNLPNLQSRLPVHQGQGTGLSPYVIGQVGGTEQVTLTTSTTPAHSHALNASTTAANVAKISNTALPGTVASPLHFYITQGSGGAPILYTLNQGACTTAGGSLPHTNMMPSLCITFVIALNGIYPSQN